MTRETNIKIYDAMMGSGKTTRIINEILKSDYKQKYMFITPLLTECHRIAGTKYDEKDLYKRPIIIANDDRSILYEYEDDAPLKDKLFKHPNFSKKGGKAESLPVLIENNDNIVSTHQLFVNLTPAVLEKAKDYILIIDEMLSVYEIYTEYSLEEIKSMFKNEWLSLKEDDITLVFHRDKYGIIKEDNPDPTKDTYYETFATLCDLGQLMLIDEKLVIWELAIDSLLAFKEVWIATYMFEDNIMSTYLKVHNIDYEIIRFGKKPSDIKHLINIYEDIGKSSLNTIGEEKSTSLSISHCKSEKVRDVLCNNLDNYVRNKIKCKKTDFMWTCVKEIKTKIQRRDKNDYSKQWLPFNIKATNAYGNIHNIAYLHNVYPNSELLKASSSRGFNVRLDIYAISEMVQFIWRSAIRNGESINLYVPSKRMRMLLTRWLNDEFEINTTPSEARQRSASDVICMNVSEYI